MQYLIPVVSMGAFALVVASILAWVNSVLTLEGEAKVKIANNGHVVTLQLGANLLDSLGEAGYSLMAQCAGGGTCATCRVKAISGVEDPNAAMLGPISPKLQKEGWILSCQTTVMNDIDIELFDALVTSWPDEISSANGADDGPSEPALPPGVAELRNVMPGFDCGVCGYDTCADYAQAIANGQTGLEACSPGGAPVLERLKQAAQSVGVVTLSPRAQKIRAALPGFDCEECGYSTCNAYAEALADGEGNVEACTPGGEPVLLKLKDIAGN